MNNAVIERRTVLGAAAAALSLGVIATAATQPAAPLALERTIPLKDVSGRIDHLAVDLGRKRLFVAELGNGTVEVVDLATGNAIRRIEGLKEPQGLAFAPDADVLAAASAGDGTVRLFRGADLLPAGTINLGDDADNIRLDTRTGNLVVGYGSGGLAVIDPTKAALLQRILLPVHPEGFQLDPEKRRAFINLPDAHLIAVVDFDAGRQTTIEPTPDLRSNFPMALDAVRDTMAVAFRKPARLVTYGIGTGKATGAFRTCSDADDVFFDVARRRIYVICGEGSVETLQQEGTDYRRLNRFKTASGARTGLFVPELDRLFVAARAGFFGLGSDAAILVLRPTD
jgi:hypothetical protein